jgi:type III secretory pathway component EscU
LPYDFLCGIFKTTAKNRQARKKGTAKKEAESMKKSIKCELDKYLCYATELSLTTCKNFIVLCSNALALMIPFFSPPPSAVQSLIQSILSCYCSTLCTYGTLDSNIVIIFLSLSHKVKRKKGNERVERERKEKKKDLLSVGSKGVRITTTTSWSSIAVGVCWTPPTATLIHAINFSLSLLSENHLRI